MAYSPYDDPNSKESKAYWNSVAMGSPKLSTQNVISNNNTWGTVKQANPATPTVGATAYTPGQIKTTPMNPAPTPAPAQPKPQVTTQPTPQPAPQVAPQATASQQAPQYAFAGQAPTYNSGDAEKRIADMYAAMEAQRQAQLEARRQRQISNLEAERSKIAPHFYNQRNMLAGQAQQNRRKFAEFLANRGQARGGKAAQAEMINQGRLQGGLGGLAQSEAQAQTEIDRQIGLANQDYEINLDEVRNKILADRTNALLAEQERGYNIGRDLYNDAKSAYDTQFKYNYENYWKDREDAYNSQKYKDELAQKQNELTNKSVTDFYKSIGYAYNPLTGGVTPSLEGKEYQDKLSETAQKATGMIPNAYANYTLTPEVKEQIAPYWNQLQQEIDRRKATPDTADDDLIPYLNNALYSKAQGFTSDQRAAWTPQLMSQEGLKNYSETRKRSLEMVGLELDNLTKDTKLAYLEPELQAKLSKEFEDLKEKMIKNEYLPEEKVAQINRDISSAKAAMMNAETSAFNAQTSRMNANTSRERLELSKQAEAKAKASPYFSQVYNKIGDYVKTLDDGDLYGEDSKSQWLKQPGSVEYNQVYDTVMNSVSNGMISPNEGELILKTYGIPLP